MVVWCLSGNGDRFRSILPPPPGLLCMRQVRILGPTFSTFPQRESELNLKGTCALVNAPASAQTLTHVVSEGP